MEKVVQAAVIDDCTIEYDGDRFEHKEDVILQPMQDTIAPKLRCSNCHYERAYYYWYRKLHFQERIVNFCPGCGHPILGVIGHG